jgi:hypothetical protein
MMEKVKVRVRVRVRFRMQGRVRKGREEGGRCKKNGSVLGWQAE